ncbi:DUF4166 domain-containing protein [Luteimonas sp. FCS-9]|uniref:DUF4166 domain-containing protein n=1 Tax=Luteimonas sp. FCS-9 TaxID=1547516 RepID=UPI00063E77F8|nr:DUF4166 domain-containing protein [Luteimonas sp. FCS-9]KLJ00126.1 hypothetical protein WQ56_10460 [Luteimonas sp. FCS-9]
MAPTLFQTLLGAAFFRLPETLRVLHGVRGQARHAGAMTIERSGGLAARACARLAGVPAAATDAALSLDCTTGPRGEIWVRRLGAPPRIVQARWRLWHRDGQLRLRRGALQLRCVLHHHDGTLYWNVVGARAFGVLPLPARLLSEVRGNEREVDGRCAFEVEAALPLVGPVFRAHGWLHPANRQD